MAYQALYRVYRSQTFDGVVGQEAVTQTLKNAVMTHKISHAYLFSGPRGTGKTSVAKIFAKAINCLHPHDGEPCNECEICRAINEGRLSDVIEIDAASNNGVEEIRDIRDKAKYAPTEAKYKVYIIDEVHMLSKGAFNALLKTLEEPPQNVIFILATTEPHKIPATIISRTQRFEFRRITEHDIVQHLAMILQKEDVAYDDDALLFIARIAEGGMRDALSILDQVIAFSKDKITLNDVMTVTGSVTYDMMDQYLTYCVQHDTTEAMNMLQRILAEGKESQRFIEDLLNYCRDLLIYKQAPHWIEKERALVSEAFQQLATQLSDQALYHMIDVLSQTQREMKLSVHGDIYLEVMTVKLSTDNVESTSTNNAIEEHENTSVDVTVYQQEIVQLQQQVQQLTQRIQTLEAGTVPSSKRRPVKETTFKSNEQAVFHIMSHSNKEQAQRVFQEWEGIKQQFTASQQGLLQNSEPRAVSNDGIVIVFPYPILANNAENDHELKQQLEQAMAKALNQPHVSVEFIDKKGWQHQVERFKEAKRSQQPKEKEDESVAMAKQIFGKDNVVTVED